MTVQCSVLRLVNVQCIIPQKGWIRKAVCDYSLAFFADGLFFFFFVGGSDADWTGGDANMRSEEDVMLCAAKIT